MAKWIKVRADQVSGILTANFLGAVGPFILMLPIIGALVMVFFVLLAVFKGLAIVLTVLWLYPLFIALAIALSIALRLRTKNAGIGALTFWAILIFGCAGATIYYINGPVKFPTMFSADYIQALPDGTAPVLRSRRHQKGKVLAKLEIGERVTVHGITLTSKEYNVTTASGLTGWVPRAAFPSDAAEMLAYTVDPSGFEGKEIQTDRFAERLMEKYMDKTPGRSSGFGPDAEVYEWRYKTNKDTLNRFIKVNAETPLMQLSSKDYKAGGTLQETTEKVSLVNILYADDCTILYLTSTGYNYLSPANTNEWWNSLTVKDLNTTEAWKMLQMSNNKTGDSANGIYSIMLFFPPFKSRNFSLTHEVLPMPDVKKVKENYKGLLGLAYNVVNALDFSSSGAVTYGDWNFPEVRVR